jgi:hypothetical protein
MAASIFKWSLILLLAVCCTSFSPYSKHPFHVSVLEIEHNASNKSLEISCKIFTDDFEKVLAKNYGTRVDLINPSSKAAMDTLVKKYILSHVSLKINGKPVVLNYIGFENESEAAYGYFEVENIPSITKVEIVNSILHDKFDDQLNIIHVKAGGNRKSTKLSYPEKMAEFNF